MIRYERQHDKDPDYYIVGLNTDFEFPLHYHRCFELTLVPEGEMQVRREKENYTLRAGDMIFKETPCTLEEVSKELSIVPSISPASSTRIRVCPTTNMLGW